MRNASPLQISNRFQTVFPTQRGKNCSVACKNPIEKRLDIRGGDAFPSDPHRNHTIAQYA